MEPLTHLLTGACLARAGLHRRVAYATAAMAVAAEFPDVDTIWSLRGPVSGLQHHRGITHSLLGLPVEALFLLFCALVWHRWRDGRARAAPQGRRRARGVDRAPVRWPALYGCLLLALLSHLLLDYTNNYGLRPFLPFNSHWYAASLVFIFDPLIFVLLLAGLLLPELFALIGQEIGGDQAKFRGSGWARAALLGVLAIWSLRAYEHNRALTLAGNQTLRASIDAAVEPESAIGVDGPAMSEPVQARPLLFARRSLASPDPFSPFRWYTATDFGSAYALGTADTRRGEIAPGQTLVKLAPSAALSVAEATTLGRVYLDWSAMPWITFSSGHRLQGSGQERVSTTVLFEDLRFFASSPLLNRGGLPPLSGFVVIGPHGEIVEGLGDRVQP